MSQPLRRPEKALIFWGEQIIEAWREAFRKVGDPECRKDPGKNVHSVVRAQDENGCDFENDEQDSGGRERSSAQGGAYYEECIGRSRVLSEVGVKSGSQVVERVADTGCRSGPRADQ